ncbi:MAG: reprolysin-like metallopeptidase, partial [Saprospiraceae bacterium]
MHYSTAKYFFQIFVLISIFVVAGEAQKPFGKSIIHRDTSQAQKLPLVISFDGVREKLIIAPSESLSNVESQNISLVSLPINAYGAEMSFEVVRTNMMEERLSRLYPDLMSFSIKSVTDPSYYGKVALNYNNLTIFLHTPEGWVTIEPSTLSGRTDQYVFVSDISEELSAFECGVVDDENLRTPDSGTRGITSYSHGTQLIQYRIALSATGEFTAAYGGTVASATTQINTLLTGINAVYENELSVRFILIGTNNSIVYTDATTDPYDPNGDRTSQAQTNITTVIGSANFDIGHVFHVVGAYGFSGVAGPDVCLDDFKASGWTGIGTA